MYGADTATAQVSCYNFAGVVQGSPYTVYGTLGSLSATMHFAYTITTPVYSNVWTYHDGWIFRDYFGNTLFSEGNHGVWPSGEVYASSCTGAMVATGINGWYGCALDQLSPSCNALCTTCPAGTYSGVNTVSLTQCTSCAAGTYGTATGATDASVCQSCGAGTYASGAGVITCVACGAGTYGTTTGATDASLCQPCVAGTYASGAGAITCVACGAGTYGNVTGASTCVPCGAGTYGNVTVATTAAVCQACAAGTYSTASGATNSSVCQACCTGTYSNVTGASTCAPCGAGTYGTATGATACAGCAANATSLSAGATTCTANAGFYDLDGSLMAYYPFNAENLLADVSGALGPLQMGTLAGLVGADPTQHCIYIGPTGLRVNI